MKKTKQPGDNISLKTKKTEEPLVMHWINAQTNLMDSLRYLIENEIQQNGVRNLQAFIPAERSFAASSAPQLDHAVNVVPRSEAVLSVPVIQPGNTEMEAAREETAASIPAQLEVPEPAFQRGRTESDEIPENPEPAAAAEDDIDDDDIEAWT